MRNRAVELAAGSLLLAALAASASASQAPQRGAGARPAGARAAEDPARAERVVAALRAVQPGAAPAPDFLEDARADAAALFSVLRDGSLPRVGPDGVAEPLSADQERWILAAVRGLERPRALTVARSALAARRDLATRVAAMRFLGAVGSAAELDELFGLAVAGEDDAPEARALDALRAAAAEILARDPAAFAQIGWRWRSLREPLIEPLVLAAAQARGARALEFLADVLEWRPSVAPLVLAKVQEVGLSLDPAANEEARDRIRPLLTGEPGVRAAAALALGALRDVEAVPELIAMLDEAEGLRANAHWALKRVTGLSLPPRADAWSAWHRAELAWIEGEGGATLERLASGSAAEVAGALRDLQAHPLAAGEVAGALVAMLESEDPAVRLLACRLSPERGDARAFQALVARFADPDPEVAAAAYRALCALTGKHLPPDARAWEILLARL